jgi:hypothetical protein
MFMALAMASLKRNPAQGLMHQHPARRSEKSHEGDGRRPPFSMTLAIV